MKKKSTGRKVAPPVTARDTSIRLASNRIENPDWSPDKDGEAGFPRYIQAETNSRESAVETLYSRKFLGISQKMAADRFRAFWELAGGSVRSLDYSQGRVDGGSCDPVGTRLQAAREMERCRQLIGTRGFRNIQAVCGEGLALAELTPHKRERLTMADNLRADLDDLATMWGMRTARGERAA